MDYYNSKFALLFAPKGEKDWAVTIGQKTWYSVPEEQVTTVWKRHEDAHKEQYIKDGKASFLFRYLKDYIRGRMDGLNHNEAYLNIRYEVEAREKERLEL